MIEYLYNQKRSCEMEIRKSIKIINGKNEISRLHKEYWYKIADEYEWCMSFIFYYVKN